MRRFLLGSLLCFSLISCAPKGIEGLLTRSYAPGQQQEGRVAYAENPPLGGAYSPLWQRCGAYPAPLYDEYAVHSLERGAIWITYSPALPTAEVAKLKSALEGYAAWLLSPRATLPSAVVISAWNAQVQATGADEPRLTVFLERYAQPLHPTQGSGQVRANTAPERGKGCASGYAGTQ
ncbi:DUF3105 domain-containing protein [Deinococcus sp.]|uniref:DUF3105 domain-containing protein n=1 Tax=Deinococcus sp. TaxID=47478 RepID=UPI003C797DAE